MSNIATKLTYLNGTKQAIKQAINEDFEVIDNNTTFREYADEISSNNAKYKDLIPKVNVNGTNTLDISNSSGLDKALVTQYGNTYQETTTGKSLFGGFTFSKTYNGITFTYNQNSSITANGTATGDATSMMSSEARNNNYLVTLSPGTYTISGSYSNTTVEVIKSDGSFIANVGPSETFKTFTVSSEISVFVRINIASGTSLNNITIYPMLEKGSTATDWEKYTGGNPAPNPDYPQEIVNINGKSTLKNVGKNLFNLTSITTTANTSTASLTNGEVTVNWTGGFNLDLYYIISNLDTSKTYTISFKHKGDALLLRNKSVSTTDILETSVDNDYTLYTLSLTNISAFQFRFVRKTTTGTAYIKDIQIEENSTASPYEPYQEQSFDLDLKSKNLFDISKVERNVYYNYGTIGSVPTIATSDKRITLSPTNSIKVKPSTQYTLSFPSAFRYAIAEMENNYISLGDSGWKTNTTYTFTTSATTNYIGFNFSKTDNSTIADNDWNTFINSGIQLEENSTATDYEPFYDINLCKIEDYKDRIYPLNGKWYLEKNIEKVVLNGSESWVLPQTNTNTLRFNCEQGLINGLDTSTMKIISNKFVNGKSSSDNDDYEHIRSAVKSYPSMIVICINKSRLSSQNINGFKTWLSNNNVTVYYIATPITTEIIESNYPTLYNQLNNIKLYEGVNHLTFTNESGLDVEFDIEYYKDWKLD